MIDREQKCPGHPYGLMRVNTVTGETTCNTCGGYMFTARTEFESVDWDVLEADR